MHQIPNDVTEFIERPSYGIAAECMIGNCQSKGARRYYANPHNATLKFVVESHAYIDLCAFHHRMLIAKDPINMPIEWEEIEPGLVDEG